MLRACFMALAAVVLLPGRTCAQSDPGRPDVLLRFHVTDQDQRFGLLLRAPERMACSVVRYRVEGAGRAEVSAALGAGGLAIVALRAPLPPGMAALRITTLGCPEGPEQARRVILGAASPDHSWRAAEALADVEGDALGQGQGGAVVQRIGRPPHIGLPGI